MKIYIHLIVCITVTLCSCITPKQRAEKWFSEMKASTYFVSSVQRDLAHAIDHQDTQKIKSLVSTHGANVNYVGKEEMTPLMWALTRQRKESYVKLLALGANPNFKTTRTNFDPKRRISNSGETSVMYGAAIAEDPFYLAKALQYGGNPNLISNTTHKESILFDAIANRRLQNAELLLAAGANIDHRNLDGITPTFRASHATAYDILYMLIKRGANLSIKPRTVKLGDKFIEGRTLAESIKQRGDGSIRVLGLEKEQRQWYNKVLEELKDRGLY